MGLKRKKNDRAAPSATSTKVIEKGTFIPGDPVLMPKPIFQSLLKHFESIPPVNRNVALSVKEYPVEMINDEIGKGEYEPTHLVVFCVRVLPSDDYNPLGVVHINKRFEHAAQLTLLWVAFIQDLSKIGLNVVASVSPCTKMYRDILTQLTRNENFENSSLPIAYVVYPFYIVHLYDYNSIMEEFQEAFHYRRDLCFVSRPWSDNNAAEEVYAASWKNIFGVFTPGAGKASYNFLDRYRGEHNLIFSATFRQNYRRASRFNLDLTFTKLSTDFLLALLWEFSRITEVPFMKLEEFEKFCVECQELKYMLASAHFKQCNIYNNIRKDNAWFRTFENNADVNKGSNRIVIDRSIEAEAGMDKGKKAFMNYVNRLMYNAESFIDEETIILMDKDSTTTKLVTAFAERHCDDQIETQNPKNYKAIEDTSNLIDKTSSANPCVALNSNETVPIISKKKRFTAPKNIENPNEDATGTSYETFETCDTKCVDVDYLDHILSPSKERLKNSLDSFGYSTVSHNTLYTHEQANTESGKMSKESQIDERSEETEDDTSDQKSKLFVPYKKPESEKFPQNPTVDKNFTETQSKIISNKPVKSPNHQKSSRTGGKIKEEGSSEAASEIPVEKNATKMQFKKSQNGRKRVFKETAKKNDSCEIHVEPFGNGSKMSKGNNMDFIDVADCLSKTKVSKERSSNKDTSVVSLYTNALSQFIENQLKNPSICQKMESNELAKKQSNEVHIDSSQSGSKMFKPNNVDSNERSLSTSVNKKAIKDVTEIKSRVFKSAQKPFKELSKNQNHKVPVESASISNMSKDNNVNSKKGVSYEATSEVTVDKNGTKDVAKLANQTIASEEPFNKEIQKVPAEASKIGPKVSKDSKVDSNATFSNSTIPEVTGFLNIPTSKINSTKDTTGIKSNKSKNNLVFEETASKKLSKNQESSKTPKNSNVNTKKAKPKSMSLENEIKQLDLILQNSGSSTEHQSLEIDEHPKTELSNSMPKDQMKNKGRISADSGYSSTTSIDQAFMSFDQKLMSADQAIELIKNKQKAFENNNLAMGLLTGTLPKSTKKNKNGKNENFLSLSDRKRKVRVRDDSCQNEISQVIFKAMEKMKSEPMPEAEEKIDNMLAELSGNFEIDKNTSTASNQNPNIDISTEEASIAKSKNAKQSNIGDDCQELSEKEDLYIKDSMDNFFECFETKRNKQKNKISLSFLQDIFFSSPCTINSTSARDNLKNESINKETTQKNMGSEQEDVIEIYLDGVKEEHICSQIDMETNNKESLQQCAENDEIKAIDVEEYRQLLLSDCDKQQRICDIINVKDKEAVINFFNIIPEGAEVLQITTDWLCTLKGYSRLGEKLKEFEVPLVYTSVFCLDHIDWFVGLIRQRNTETSLGQPHRFRYNELQFSMIDRDVTFEVIETDGPESGRFQIKQNYSENI